MVEAFLGAPIVVDAAGTGSVSHRPRLFWQNFCSSEILQAAFPFDILPHPPLAAILHPFHLPTVPTYTSTPPFALHNRRGQPRITMPTLVSSHAFRPEANGAPGEGKLWNTALRRSRSSSK